MLRLELAPHLLTAHWPLKMPTCGDRRKRSCCQPELLLGFRMATSTHSLASVEINSLGTIGIRVLQKSTPLYKAMKEKYPKSYEEILDVFSDGVARGTPQAELIGGARAKLQGLIKALLPQADDAVLIAFGRLVADQYRALQGQDKAACYKYASGVADEATIRLLPKDLIERELELNAMIISSARNQGAAVKTDASWEKIIATLDQRGFTDSDRQMLTGTSISPSNYARYCDFAIILYQAVTNLPTKEAASVLREIFKE